MQGTNISAVPPMFLLYYFFCNFYADIIQQTLNPCNVRLRSDLVTVCKPICLTAFCRTAPVGNFKIHLNLRKLTADDFLSLKENVSLLTPSMPLSFQTSFILVALGGIVKAKLVLCTTSSVLLNNIIHIFISST